MSDGPDSPPRDGWLIFKEGRGFYRPDARGYTSNKHEAGRYSYADAMKHSHPNGPDGPRDGMTIRHESCVPDTAGFIRLDHHNAALAAERAKVAALVEALTPFANALKGNYSHQSDELPISMGHGKYDLRWVLPLGDFRRALTVITEAGQ